MKLCVCEYDVCMHVCVNNQEYYVYARWKLVYKRQLSTKWPWFVSIFITWFVVYTTGDEMFDCNYW